MPFHAESSAESSLEDAFDIGIEINKLLAQLSDIVDCATIEEER
jgi:hypothetical protein